MKANVVIHVPMNLKPYSHIQTHIFSKSISQSISHNFLGKQTDHLTDTKWKAVNIKGKWSC